MNTRSSKLPPGPRGYPIIGPLLHAMRDPLRFCVESARRYGDIVHFQVGPRHIYLLNHPDYVKHVLQDHTKIYRRRTPDDTFKSLFTPFGQGLITSEGELWRRQRRLIQPTFHRQRIALLADQMNDCITTMIERWRRLAQGDKSIDVTKELAHLTQTIVGKTLLNTSSAIDTNVISHAVDIGQQQVMPLARSAALKLPMTLPTRGYVRYQRALRAVNELIYRVIAERRRGGLGNDLLSLLMSARDEETGEGMTDKQLRDEIVTLILAGYDTTTGTLSFALHLLTAHPDVQHKLQAELSAVLNGQAPTFEHLARLTYTHMVLDETMRLYPSGWLIFRTAVQNDKIAGYDILAGSLVLTSPYVMGRHTRYWDRPEQFEPERFEEDRSKERPRLAYFPFGSGPRGCVGESFAMMEMQLVISHIAQAFHLQQDPHYHFKVNPQFTLQPRQGVRVILRKRS